MKFRYLTACVLCAAIQQTSLADDQTPVEEGNNAQSFGQLTVEVEPEQYTSLLDKGEKISDITVDSEELRTRGSTLGEALKDELGVRMNQYGGGASAPVIRGMTGKRLKILNNNTTTGDMANVSPDHAIDVEPSLAKQIEIIRGPKTLLYSPSSVAGLVNTIDDKIPEEFPDKPFGGSLGYRYSSGDDQSLTTAKTTLGIADHVVLHAEGMTREANDYKVRSFINKDGDKVGRVPDSYARAKSGTLGLSLVDNDMGFLGVSYTKRRDHYGLPGHSEALHDTEINIFKASSTIYKPYLIYYPQLMAESDIDYDNPGVFRHIHMFKPDTPTPPPHPVGGRPWIDMTSERWDVRGQINNPLPGIEKIRATLGTVRYHHDELEDDYKADEFRNRSLNARIEFSHVPFHGLTGSYGFEYLRSKNFGEGLESRNYQRMRDVGYSPLTLTRPQPLLQDNKMENYGFFGLEQLEYGDFLFELGGRIDKQYSKMYFDEQLIEDNLFEDMSLPKWRRKIETDKSRPDISPRREYMYSGAFAAHWNFYPGFRANFIFSHQERAPNTQELYAHGPHAATNSAEVGNMNLTKEKSNSFELGLAYQDDRFNFRTSAYYTRYQNYIFAQTMNADRGPASIQSLDEPRLLRYNQSGARMWGVEGELDVKLNRIFTVGIFGDFMKGRLIERGETPAADYGVRMAGEKREREMVHLDNTWVPRMPAPRWGAKLDAQITEHLRANVRYTYTKNQHDFAEFEEFTPGNEQVDFGIFYDNSWQDINYSIYAKANNIGNSKVYSHESYLSEIPQMGRNYMVGVQLSY